MLTDLLELLKVIWFTILREQLGGGSTITREFFTFGSNNTAYWFNGIKPEETSFEDQYIGGQSIYIGE